MINSSDADVCRVLLVESGYRLGTMRQEAGVYGIPRTSVSDLASFHNDHMSSMFVPQAVPTCSVSRCLL